MNELPRIIPDVKVLLALTPEELAAKMLFLLKKRNDAKFHAGNLQKELWGHYSSGQPPYPRQYEYEINLALSEAWAWLHAQGLVVPDMENGQYGWVQLSRRARVMETESDFVSFKVASLLPREILHSRIAGLSLIKDFAIASWLSKSAPLNQFAFSVAVILSCDIPLEGLPGVNDVTVFLIALKPM